MTEDQAKQYRTVEIRKYIQGCDPIDDKPGVEGEWITMAGYFHRFVEQEFDVWEEVGGPPIANSIMMFTTKKTETRALIEHEDGTLAYYKPTEIKFTDRK